MSNLAQVGYCIYALADHPMLEPSRDVRPVRARLSLAALRHNLTRARALAGAAEVTAVVKANAYGHGIGRVLPALDGAARLAVASIDEALALREAGARQPLLLLEGIFEADELALCVAGGFEIVVHEPGQLAMLEQARLERPLAAWLKIDSGMGRLGFRPEQAGAAHTRLVATSAIGRIGLMTHLASADDPGSEQTAAQLASFAQATKEISGERSIANSAGLIGWPRARVDMVRPGVMLYGISPMIGRTGIDEGLLPVMTLETRLIAAKSLNPGESVGYGATWQAERAQRIGIAAIGYGDGYPRHAPTGTPVLVGGRRTRLLGRVSMDMIAMDLDGLDDVGAGTKVVLWGEGLPVEEVADAAGTIAYELLCGVTARVPFALVG